MGRQIRCVPRLSQPHGAERRAAHDALRPLRMRVPRRVGGVVHRGGVSGGNAVPRISSLGTVEGARPAVQETLRTGMIQSRLLRRVGLLAALAAGYFVAGKVGLQVAYVHPSATVVWPPSGLTLAAFLLLGYEVWPAILLGAFLVNITTARDVATSAAIAAGNTLEGLVGAYLVNRFARGHRACERARDIFKLAGLAALGSTAVSATAGVAALSLAGFARWTDFGPIWSTWWMGDAVSDLVIAGGALVGRATPRALDPAPGARGCRAARVPRRRRHRRLRRAGAVEGQALSAGIPVRPAAVVGGVPVRAARRGDGRRTARRRRDLGDAARLRPLRPAAVQRIAAAAAGVPRGLGRHHSGAGGGRGGANRSRGPAAPAGGERSAHGTLQLPTTRARARRGNPAVVPHRSAVCGGADGSGRPQEGQRSLWPPGRQHGPAARGGSAAGLVPGDRHRRALRRGRGRAGAARDGGCGGVARGPAHRRPGGAGRRAAAALRERRRGRASARRGYARGALECRGPLAGRQQSTPSP